MDSFEFFNGLYDTEWARREQISNSAAVSIGLLSVVGGILVFIAERVDFTQASTGKLLTVLTATACVCFLVAIYFVVRSYHGHTYRRVAHAGDLHKWQKTVDATLAQSGAGSGWPQFCSALEAKFAEAADVNGRINASRSEALFVANQWILITLVACGFAGAIAVFNVRQQPAGVQAVTIVSTAEKSIDAEK